LLKKRDEINSIVVSLDEVGCGQPIVYWYILQEGFHSENKNGFD